MSAPSKPTLLTIDDDESIRISMSAFFESCGFDVIEARDGREGLELVRSDRPDIVITDLQMPRMNGLELVDAVRRLDDNLPIIMISGGGELGEALQALRLGAWDYLTKPVVNLEELELAVARCLERARLVRENRAYRGNLERLVAERSAQVHKLTTAVEQSANTVVITNFNGVIEYVNPKFSVTTGYTPEEAIGKTPRVLKSGRHTQAFYGELWGEIRAGREWRGEFCNRRKNGAQYWEMCSIAPLKDDSGAITHFVAIKEDITERKQYEKKLFRQANFDALTGLPNRHHLQACLETQLEQLNRESALLSLIVLGIDNLKFINDTFGHDFGDRLLQEVSGRIRNVCGEDFFVARFMGDEFVVVPALTTVSHDPQEQAEKVRSIVNDLFVIDRTEIRASASIGVVTYPQDGECATTLLKNAEAAMYQAKKSGKNMIAYYTRELNSRLMERFERGARLHRALDRGEFSLHYQPQISLAGNAIVGVEALLRWTPPGEPAVPPSEFIPLLEESGLIVAVGEWALWRACSQCAEWQRAGLPPLRVSVNISALQFMRSDLDLTVRRVLESTGLDPSLLCLELTESMIMIDSDRTMETMAALTETGVMLSLDDFGTGYSSLSYLGRLPINELKIDQSFVKRMLSTKNDAAVVNTIIAMGHGLEMELVAEGVETEEQLNYLAEKRCGIMQGYLFSVPLPPDEFVSFYENRALPKPDTAYAHLFTELYETGPGDLAP